MQILMGVGDHTAKVYSFHRILYSQARRKKIPNSAAFLTIKLFYLNSSYPGTMKYTAHSPLDMTTIYP